MTPPELRLDWVAHEAARFAVTRWHYSKSLPPPPHARLGVWERGRFIGVVVFARGAAAKLLRPYGLSNIEGAELVRVALDSHRAPVSRIVAVALRLLHAAYPKLRLVVSFADPAEGHVGTIYQAGNWIYAGRTPPSLAYRDALGRLWHNRMTSPKGARWVFGHQRLVVRPDECVKVRLPGKHRYLMPLDPEMRERVRSFAQPYPRRDAPEVSEGTPRHQRGGGGCDSRPGRSTPAPIYGADCATEHV